MKATLQLKEAGEFRAVRHTGHTYDEEGNEIHGEILQESAWGHNLITSVGLDAILNTSSVYITIVAGAGNTAPVLANTTLQTYKGKRTSQIMSSRAVNLVPDVDGYMTITTIYRATFNPGALGSGAQNIAEAGTAMADSGATTGATNLFSRGLLVDSFGAPLVISLNATTEYLDIYWKHIRYIPESQTGTVNLTIMGSVISHSYTVRPLFFDPTSVNAGTNLHSVWWMLTVGQSADRLNGLAPSLTDTSYGGAYFGPRVFDGNISALNNAFPAGTQLPYNGSSWTYNTYVTGTHTRTCKLNLIPTEGNLVSGIKSITLKMGFQGWQMQINPVIMKNATPARVLSLDFAVSVANK